MKTFNTFRSNLLEAALRHADMLALMGSKDRAATLDALRRFQHHDGDINKLPTRQRNLLFKYTQKTGGLDPDKLTTGAVRRVLRGYRDTYQKAPKRKD